MKQYLDLMKEIMEYGTLKNPARPGMPRTKELFGCMMKFDLQKGFPLLTTKKMFTKGIVGELLWFLRGDTNIKYLVDNGIHIWDGDAYRFYRSLCTEKEPLTKEKFIEKIEKGPYQHHLMEHPLSNNVWYAYGDCGQIYGYQWRNWNGYVDQISTVIENIKKNPNSRYHVITAWQPSSFLPGLPSNLTGKAALPACHMLMQLSVRDNKYLDLSMTQRSADFVLGVPFNIASYALLLCIIASETNLEPGVFTWFGNSVHIYENHFDAVKEQLTREPLPLCTLMFKPKDDITKYEISDFEFVNYQSHPRIKAELSVGV